MYFEEDSFWFFTDDFYANEVHMIKSIFITISSVILVILVFFTIIGLLYKQSVFSRIIGLNPAAVYCLGFAMFLKKLFISVPPYSWEHPLFLECREFH